MEGGAVSEKQASSYRYWVREATADAAPLPVPKMLSTEDLSNIPSQPSLGSVWNRVSSTLSLPIISDFLKPKIPFCNLDLLCWFCYPRLSKATSQRMGERRILYIDDLLLLIYSQDSASRRPGVFDMIKQDEQILLLKISEDFRVLPDSEFDLIDVYADFMLVIIRARI